MPNYRGLCLKKQYDHLVKYHVALRNDDAEPIITVLEKCSNIIKETSGKTIWFSFCNIYFIIYVYVKHIHTYEYIHAYMHIWMYKWIYSTDVYKVYIHRCINTYIYTYIHILDL